MTLDQFHYFLETARFEHVGKASSSLHISASAISYAITSLEEELGCALFERQGKRILLTEKGRYFRDRIEKILDQIEELQHELSETKTTLAGFYRLGASHFLATHYLGKAWTKLQGRYPELKVELSSMATAQVIQDVLSGSLDGGLCFSPLRHPDLKALDLHRGQLQVVVRKGHPILRSSKREQTQFLSNYPATLHKSVAGVDTCEDHPMFQKFGITPKVQSLWDNDAFAIETIKGSDSWSMIPDIVVETNRSAVQALDLGTHWDAPYSISFLFRSHRVENPFLKVLHQELKVMFRS